MPNIAVHMTNSVDPDQKSYSVASICKGISVPILRVIMAAWLKVLHHCNKNSAEGVIAPAGAKVTEATIRMWLLNKFISFLAVLSWKTGLKKCRQSA